MNVDGTFSGILKAPATGFSKTSYFSVYYLDSNNKPVPSLTASAYPASSSNSALTPKDFAVTIPYCDQSPAYQYNLQKSNLIVAANTNLQNLYSGKTLIQIKDPSLNPFETYINAGVNDPIAAQGPINDAGGAILSGAAAHSFSQNTADAQRLLIRTQFQPNFARLACSYAYLTGTLPVVDVSQMKDFAGNLENITASPIGNPYSLTGPLAPQYYLFDIVRWSDATPAQATQSASTTKSPPMYQATTDEWYLLDYSDKTDKHRNLFGSIQKLPSFEAGTAMRIFNTSRVLFVAIHLAPPAKVSGALPSTSPGISLIPTEQAWYDNISIKYKLNASTVDPVNVADLKTLINTVLGVAAAPAGPAGVGAAAAAAAPPPPLSAAAAAAAANLSAAQQTSIDSFIGALADLKKDVGNFCSGAGALIAQNPVDCLMVNSTGQLDAVAATVLTAATGYAESDCKTLASNLSGKTDMASLGGNQYTLRDCLYEAMADTTDGKSASTLITSETAAASTLNGNLTNSVNMHKEKPVVSLYQGLYNAALLTNLTQLPKGFTSAANITGTWTATFAGVKTLSSTQQQQVNAVQAPVVAGAAAPAAKAAPTALKSSNTTQQPAGSQQQTASQQAAPAANQQSASQPTSNSICALTTTTLGTGLTSQTTCTSTGPPTPGLHLEGIEWWDISVAVPVAGFKDVSYQQTSTSSGSTVNSVLPTAAVTRENAYGMFDMFVLGGTDLYYPPNISYPYLSVGLPFSGKVFDKPYFAVGENINVPSTVSAIPKIGQYLSKFIPIQIRPMFGWVANKEFETIAASGSTPAHKVYLRRSWDPQFSIEISIKSVASKLSKNSTSNNTKTTTTNGTANPASSGSGG